MSKGFLLFVLLAAISNNSFSQQLTESSRVQIISMLEGFRQGCSVGGGSVSEAISMVRQLAASVAAASSDDKCKGLAQINTTLNNAASAAENLYPSLFERGFNNDTDIKTAGLQSRKKEILYLISQTKDATELGELKVELRTTQLELDSSRGEASAIESNEKMLRRSKALGLIAQNTYQALDSILSNEQCILNKPSLLETVSGFSVGIANSVSLLSPVGNSAAMVGWGTGLIGKLISFFKQKSALTKGMKFETDLMPIYLSCTLEKLNEMYCAAEDAQNALDKLKESSTRISQKDPIWSGSDLLKEDLPLAMEWLNRLRNGGAPSKGSDSIETNFIDLLEFYLKASLRYAEGRVHEYGDNYKPDAPKKAMWSDLRSVVIGISEATCPPSGNGNPTASSGNPICEFVTGDQIKFFLAGIRDEASYRYLQGPNRNLSFSDYRDPDFILQQLQKCRVEQAGCLTTEIEYTPSSVLSHFQELHKLGMDRFKIYKARAASGDLLLIFASASPASQSLAEKKRSPLGSWENTRRFLMKIESQQSGRILSQIGIRENVLATIDLIIAKINCVKTKSCEPGEARDAILDATRILRDSTELNSRIIYLVKSFVDYSVYGNPNSQDSWALQYLASRDFIEEMQAYYTKSNTKISVRDNVSAVQATVVSAYVNFKANYGELLKQSLQTIENFRSVDQRPFRNLKIFLCYQTLSLGWDSGFQNCLKVVGEPAMRGGFVAPVITQALYQSKSMGERACTYRNFLRKNAIFEQRPR